MTGTRRPIKERLLRHVALAPNGCWLWTGAKNNKGYGQIGNCGKIVLAHRVSFELHKGESIVGMQILHKCDTPACINPDHLFAGNAVENMKDMHSKGRGQHGSGHRWAKLADSDVAEIRRISAGMTHKHIAERYGVSRSAITQILSGKRWSHATQEYA